MEFNCTLALVSSNKMKNCQPNSNFSLSRAWAVIQKYFHSLQFYMLAETEGRSKKNESTERAAAESNQ